MTMRIAFVLRNPENLTTLEAVFLAAGFIIADNPEVVVVAGGDGTLLRAERRYPGLPKALIKDSSVGNLYMEHTAEQLAQALKDKRYGIEEKLCLEAQVHTHTYRAANDVIVRNAKLTQAIRFSVAVNGEVLNGELIGDGAVVATPLGSTAYYHTITRSSFEKGVGIAFNNIHNKHALGPIVTDQCDITITILRGPADLGVDNSEHLEELNEGDVVKISRSMTPLRLIRIH